MMTLAVTFSWRKISKQSPSESSTSMKMMSAVQDGARSQRSVSATEEAAPTTSMSGNMEEMVLARLSLAIFSSSTISAFIWF